MSNTSMKDIYTKLSQIDLSNFVEKKMNLTYLSWANAWQVVMDHYPDSTWQMLPLVNHSDSTVEVWVSVTIEGNTRTMWLPVMDNRNNAINNPNARQISDARMRCLVKCLSMFGLGLYIYQGEDLPRPEPVNMDVVEVAATQIVEFIKSADYTEEEKRDSVKEIWNELNEEQKKAAWLAKTKGGWFSQDDKQFIREAV